MLTMPKGLQLAADIIVRHATVATLDSAGRVVHAVAITWISP